MRRIQFNSKTSNYNCLLQLDGVEYNVEFHVDLNANDNPDYCINSVTAKDGSELKNYDETEIKMLLSEASLKDYLENGD